MTSARELQRKRKKRQETGEGGGRETALVSVVDICGETRRGREEMFWRKSGILLLF